MRTVQNIHMLVIEQQQINLPNGTRILGVQVIDNAPVLLVLQEGNNITVPRYFLLVTNGMLVPSDMPIEYIGSVKLLNEDPTVKLWSNVINYHIFEVKHFI